MFGKTCGEVIDACTGTKAPPKKADIVHLDAPKTLDEAGYGSYIFRPKCVSSLWATILYWMSGECGLYIYIILCILAKSAALWFHAHNWAIGSDPRPRLLQSNGEFLTLPAGMRACELLDMSLMFLREINLALTSWRETFAEQIQLVAAHLSPDYITKLIPGSLWHTRKPSSNM